jgi:hypothetical protein
MKASGLGFRQAARISDAIRDFISSPVVTYD